MLYVPGVQSDTQRHTPTHTEHTHTETQDISPTLGEKNEVVELSSLPFYGSRRLGADVVRNPVNPRDLVDNPAREHKKTKRREGKT